jgi:hypothetical protein
VARSTRLDPDLIERIAAAVGEGTGPVEAAAANGVPRSTFYDWLRWGRSGRRPYADLHRKVLSRTNGAAARGLHLIHSAIPATKAAHPADVPTQSQSRQQGGSADLTTALADLVFELATQQPGPHADALAERALALARTLEGSDAAKGNAITSVRRLMFRLDGEYWSVGVEGQEFRLKDSKGLRCIARLLREPGTDIHVLALAGKNGDVAATERARVNVTRTIRDAIRRIARHDRDLASHLGNSVKTGRCCVYRPLPGLQLHWRL